MVRLPAPRTIVLVCLLAVGAYGLYTGLNRSRTADATEDEVVATAAPATVEAPLPRADEVLKPPESLALKVRVGDRFPLMKSVRQILKQPSPQGGTSISQSLLELVMSVSVEEVRPPDARGGTLRMAVRYHSVRFSQDLPGHELRYDSDNPPRQVPLELQAYHGLKGNGFQFWLAADNQIVETVGFDAFLDRCLRGVPPQHREHVQALVESTSGTDGVANFVDQSIGILPADKVREGATWTTQKKYVQPVPMWLRNQYTLKRLHADTAEIEILGSVERIASFVDRAALGTATREFERPNQASESVAVEIQTGHTAGSYVIDRQTGLPRESRVEQVLAMTVHLPGGVSFPQEKTTLTTIGYFTPDRAEAIQIGDAPRDGSVQQVQALELRDRPRR